MFEQGVSTVLGVIINDAYVYGSMIYFSSFATAATFAVVLFLIIRLFWEAHAAGDGKSNLATLAFGLSRTLIYLLLYSASGLVLFFAFFNVVKVYTLVGGVDIINKELFQLRVSINSTPQETRSWYEAITENAIDALAIPGGFFTFAAYGVLNLLYQFINYLVDFMFAIGVAVVYGYGFVAIPSQLAPENYNLMPGFVRAVTGLAVWIVVESILLFFIYIIVTQGGPLLMAPYNGFGFGAAGYTTWTIAASVIMIIIILLRAVAAPLVAYFFAMNQPINAALAAPTLLAANKALDKFTDVMQSLAGGVAGQSMPMAEGDRTRDKLTQSLSDLGNTTIPVGAAVAATAGAVSSVAGSAADGLKNLFTGPESASESSPDVTSTSGDVSPETRNETSISGSAGGSSGSSVNNTGAAEVDQPNMTDTPDVTGTASESSSPSSANDADNMHVESHTTDGPDNTDGVVESPHEVNSDNGAANSTQSPDLSDNMTDDENERG